MRLFKEFSAYSSVAILSAIADWIVFVVLFQILGATVLFAQGTARMVGGMVSFASNRSWSFREQMGHGLYREAGRFLILYAASYALSLAAIFTYMEIIGMPVYVAKIAADGTCFLFNFAGMRAYVFSRRPAFAHGARATFVVRQIVLGGFRALSTARQIDPRQGKCILPPWMPRLGRRHVLHRALRDGKARWYWT